jgi:hypothetical protein
MFVAKPQPASLRQYMIWIKIRCHKLIEHACDPYRPELQYMRGPGPKWWAKHNVAPQRATFRATS